MIDRADADAYGDMPAHQLVEEHHQEELRQRYYGLLQELRVLLPGVQVLVAFLLTVPFALGFDKLDESGRRLYGVALWAGLMAVIAFVSPTVFHRIGGRTLRAERLILGIRTTRVGLGFLALSLLSAALVVTRFVFDPMVAGLFVGTVAAAMFVFWLVVPIRSALRHRRR